jgi:hypothetical protein
MFDDVVHKKAGKRSGSKKKRREESSDDSRSSDSSSDRLTRNKKLKKFLKKFKEKFDELSNSDCSSSESDTDEESETPKKKKNTIGGLPSKRKQALPRMYEAMKTIDSRFDGCVATIQIHGALLKATVDGAPAFVEPLRDGAQLKGGDERLQSAVEAQTAGLKYSMRGCERVLTDRAKALNDLTTGIILHMHALSRTSSAMITEGAGATPAEAGIAAILSDIPRDAAALIAPQAQAMPFFRDGARGAELSGHTDTTDTAAIASAAATAAVAAVLQKPVSEQRTPSLPSPSSVTVGEPRATPQPRTGTPPSRSLTITPAHTQRPKKPFSKSLFRKKEKQKPRAKGSSKKSGKGRA